MFPNLVARLFCQRIDTTDMSYSRYGMVWYGVILEGWNVDRGLDMLGPFSEHGLFNLTK